MSADGYLPPGVEQEDIDRYYAGEAWWQQESSDEAQAEAEAQEAAANAKRDEEGK